MKSVISTIIRLTRAPVNVPDFKTPGQKHVTDSQIKCKIFCKWSVRTDENHQW